MNEFTKALLEEEKERVVPITGNIWKPLIGEWDFEWVDHRYNDELAHLKGEWIFSEILDGAAIQDIFICPSRDEYKNGKMLKREYGTTIRIYNTHSKCWEIFYGCSDEATRLQAQKVDEQIILTELTEHKMKWVFSDIQTNSFHWQNIMSQDGINWTVIIDIYATRKQVI